VRAFCSTFVLANRPLFSPGFVQPVFDSLALHADHPPSRINGLSFESVFLYDDAIYGRSPQTALASVLPGTYFLKPCGSSFRGFSPLSVCASLLSEVLCALD